MKKTLFTMVLVLSLLVTPTFANANNSTTLIDTSELNMQSVTEVPDGIVPIVINSQEEFDEFVNSINSTPTEIHIKSSEKSSTLHEIRSPEMFAASVIYTTRRETSKSVGAASINLIADIQISASGSFGQIVGSNQYTSLTGYTIGLEWVQGNAYSIIQNGGRSIDVYGNGTLKYYLLVNGGIQITAVDHSLSLSHSIY